MCPKAPTSFGHCSSPRPHPGATLSQLLMDDFSCALHAVRWHPLTRLHCGPQIFNSFTYNVSSSQHLMDDFICALRKRVLLQGRLYVFEEHLVFYCHFFGYRKAVVVPLKARHMMQLWSICVLCEAHE